MSTLAPEQIISKDLQSLPIPIITIGTKDGIIKDVNTKALMDFAGCSAKDAENERSQIVNKTIQELLPKEETQLPEFNNSIQSLLWTTKAITQGKNIDANTLPRFRVRTKSGSEKIYRVSARFIRDAQTNKITDIQIVGLEDTRQIADRVESEREISFHNLIHKLREELTRKGVEQGTHAMLDEITKFFGFGKSIVTLLDEAEYYPSIRRYRIVSTVNFDQQKSAEKVKKFIYNSDSFHDKVLSGQNINTETLNGNDSEILGISETAVVGCPIRLNRTNADESPIGEMIFFSDDPSPLSHGDIARLEIFVQQYATIYDIVKRAYYDGMTKLLNKDQFLIELDRKLNEQWRHCQEIKQQSKSSGGLPNYFIGLTVADVDRLKAWNDKFTQSGGDAVIMALAEEWRGIHQRGEDLTSRYTADSFAAIGGRIETEADLVSLCEKTQQSIAANINSKLTELFSKLNVPVQLDESLKCSLSYGIALVDLMKISPQKWTEVKPILINNLINAADLAAHEAKRAGRNKIIRHRGYLLAEKINKDQQDHYETFAELKIIPGGKKVKVIELFKTKKVRHFDGSETITRIRFNPEDDQQVLDGDILKYTLSTDRGMILDTDRSKTLSQAEAQAAWEE